MRKNVRFLGFYLLHALLLLSINTAHSQSHLTMHKVDGSAAEGVKLDNIERLSFSGGNLSVKTSDGNSAVYALDNVAKLRFENVIPTDVNNSTSNRIDVVVYANQAGEVVVESPVAIQSLALLGVDGKMLRIVETRHATSLQTTLNVSSLPTGVYLIRIETLQGTVVKKMIKQ